MAEGYNPEYNPTGVEGAIDTNILPWLPLPNLEGVSIKPLRASVESGFFSVIIRLETHASLPAAVYLGGLDLMLLSGALTYDEGGARSLLEPGTWGYIAANSKVDKIVATEAAELLVNFYNGVAFLGRDSSVSSILTAMDILALAKAHHIQLVANTLAGCSKNSSGQFFGEGVPLAIARQNAGALVVASAETIAKSSRLCHPHFVDTRQVPWAIIGDMPDVGLKLLRVSEETGVVSLIVRHNGVAPPHNHLGAGDFLILQGRLGYRAGPPEGCGPGVWVFEPAGARHDATQRVGDEDLIYTANIYGPIAFDEGRGTPVSAVLSWMDYKAIAEAFGAKLVPNTNTEDASLLAWAPLKTIEYA